MKRRNALAYHAYEGVSLDADEQARLGASLGGCKAMILRNHGLLTCGATVAEAFILLFYLHRSCEVQIAAQAGGASLYIPSAEVCEHTARQYEEDEQPLGMREWPPLLRLLDRVDPGWRG